MKQPVCWGIIPARFASSRFPGKPLAEILGRPMFWHVYRRAIQCNGLFRVVLATDDQRIADAAERLEVPFVLTREDHQSGSDRVFEAAIQLGLPEDAVVVNIQGDEPALDPAHISAVLDPFFQDGEVKVTTLACPISREDVGNPNKVKVVLAVNGNALYFSRAPIPYAHNLPPGCQGSCFGHIGLYAYSLEALELFTGFPPALLELREGLEQLRFLEHNIPIRVALVGGASQAVDVPGDIAKVEQILLGAQKT